jgi:hypothetical protein
MDCDEPPGRSSRVLGLPVVGEAMGEIMDILCVLERKVGGGGAVSRW